MATQVALNVYQGYVAHRLLRDFRAELYERLLALPADRLPHTSPAQLVSVVLAEAGELAVLLGHAFSVHDRLNEPWQELLDDYSLTAMATTRHAEILASLAPPGSRDRLA